VTVASRSAVTPSKETAPEPLTFRLVRSVAVKLAMDTALALSEETLIVSSLLAVTVPL
jgi:hypothetical protein